MAQKDIQWVIVFPNELEKLEAFNFETGEDLNQIGDGRFIRSNYYSDDTIDKVISELDVSFDVVLTKN